MKAFLRELRKRHVVKVGIAYLIVSWLVLQLAAQVGDLQDQVGERLNLLRDDK
jgi:urea transporter